MRTDTQTGRQAGRRKNSTCLAQRSWQAGNRMQCHAVSLCNKSDCRRVAQCVSRCLSVMYRANERLTAAQSANGGGFKDSERPPPKIECPLFVTWHSLSMTRSQWTQMVPPGELFTTSCYLLLFVHYFMTSYGMAVYHCQRHWHHSSYLSFIRSSAQSLNISLLQILPTID